MADYLVTGKKGNGKSLVVVGRMRDALKQGRPVATNLNLWLEHLLPHKMRNTRAYRLPDQPTRADLDALGEGNDTLRTTHYDEGRNGVLVLDELATWLNARTFSDKTRQGVLDWLVHSRKLGWDTYLLAQNPNQIDKQVREALCEYHVICRRLDRLKVPGIGLKLPRVHMAFVKFGMERDSITAERWTYRGNSLFAAYDTTQRFSAAYSDGLYSYLPPWHLTRTTAKPAPAWRKLLDSFKAPPRYLPKPRHPLVELVAKLPPDQRPRHINRLDRLGLLTPSLPAPA